MELKLKQKSDMNKNNLLNDIDDISWRKIELLRLAFDIVDKSEEYESRQSNAGRLEYLLGFAGEIIEKVESFGE